MRRFDAGVIPSAPHEIPKQLNAARVAPCHHNCLVFVPFEFCVSQVLFCPALAATRSRCRFLVSHAFPFHA